MNRAASDEWTLTGHVDAENGFGANIRNRFSCSVVDNGDTRRGSAVIHD